MMPPAATERPPGLQSGWERLKMQPMDNCAVKSVVSGVLGGGMGLMFGMLFAGSGDLSHIPVPDSVTGKYPPTPKFQWGKHFKEVGRSSLWYARSFGVVGFLFAGSECVIEKTRGKTDLWNNVGGGCMAGAVMAHKGGPSAMLIGCAGFSAFSLVIDSVMGH
jgi:import inner membrane translocase subunit TIM22